MSKQPPNTEDETNEVPVTADDEYPVDRLKARVNESLGKRPFTVYLVLFAGAATLLILLAIVWISSGNDGNGQSLICTDISADDARTAVLSGQVERVNILVNREDPTDSLTGVQLRYVDDSCRQTPQGADVRAQLFSVIGAVELYNQFNGNTVQVHYQSQNVENELLVTSTPSPTIGPTETATVEQPSPTVRSATETASPVPTVEATVQPPTATTVSQPAASPTQSSLPVGDTGA